MNRTRRKAIAGASVAVLMAGTISYEGWRHFARHYLPTPYDDLLSLLPDREAAKQVGRAFLATNSAFVAAHAAAALRKHIAERSLAVVLQEELSAGELVEAGHWLLPQTLVGLCALAAKT